MKITHTIVTDNRFGSDTNHARVVGQNFKATSTSSRQCAAEACAKKFAERYYPTAKWIITTADNHTWTFTLDIPEEKRVLVPLDKLSTDGYKMLLSLLRHSREATAAVRTLRVALYEIIACEQLLRACSDFDQLNHVCEQPNRILEALNQHDAGSYWITVDRMIQHTLDYWKGQELDPSPAPPIRTDHSV